MLISDPVDTQTGSNSVREVSKIYAIGEQCKAMFYFNR